MRIIAVLCASQQKLSVTVWDALSPVASIIIAMENIIFSVRCGEMWMDLKVLHPGSRDYVSES